MTKKKKKIIYIYMGRELLHAIRKKLLINYETYKFITYEYEEWKDEMFENKEANGNNAKEGVGGPSSSSNSSNSSKSLNITTNGAAQVSSPKKRLSQTPLLSNSTPVPEEQDSSQNHHHLDEVNGQRTTDAVSADVIVATVNNTIRHTTLLTEAEWLVQVKKKIQSKCFNL
ncbi:hypothetical protein RFI_06085, partial [Reticulomyxa filosa]